jgi:hypothetical protein
MKVFQYRSREDYGFDYYITLIQVKRWCLIQSCFATSIYGGKFPYLNITMGGGRLIAINFDIWKIGVCVELISRSWFK